jgi:hypothetical protein
MYTCMYKLPAPQHLRSWIGSIEYLSGNPPEFSMLPPLVEPAGGWASSGSYPCLHDMQCIPPYEHTPPPQHTTHHSTPYYTVAAGSTVIPSWRFLHPVSALPCPQSLFTTFRVGSVAAAAAGRFLQDSESPPLTLPHHPRSHSLTFSGV